MSLTRPAQKDSCEKLALNLKRNKCIDQIDKQFRGFVEQQQITS
jgi:hypothetical protein